MLELGIAAAVVVGAFWIFGVIVGGLFKLTFGLFAALVGGMLAILGIGLAAVLVVPIVLFALIPFLLPAFVIAALVWVIARAARPAPYTQFRG